MCNKHYHNIIFLLFWWKMFPAFFDVWYNGKRQALTWATGHLLERLNYFNFILQLIDIILLLIFLVENARLLHGPFYLWDLLSCLNFILQLIDTISLLLNFGGKRVLFTYWIPSVYTRGTEYVFVNFRLDLLKLERTPSN